MYAVGTQSVFGACLDHDEEGTWLANDWPTTIIIITTITFPADQDSAPYEYTQATILGTILGQRE